MKSKKILKIIIGIFIPLFLIVSGIIFYKWYVYSDKHNLLKRFSVDNSKDVYILGTIGKKHFNRINNYSMEDIISVIDNVNPDLVLLTAKDEYYRDYSIIDGDISTCVAYSHCIDNDIPIKLIDWWLVDNIYPDFATTNLRDDNIFIKINRLLEEVPSNIKILIVTGADNFYEQIARFNVAGFKKKEIEDLKSYFAGSEESFSFPPLASKIWKDRTYFYAYVLPKIVKENDYIFDSVKDKFLNFEHDKFYRHQIKYCKYLNNNILYK